jgi:hypothetical protein
MTTPAREEGSKPGVGKEESKPTSPTSGSPEGRRDVKVEKTEEEIEKEKVLEEIQAILRQYNNIESDIPLTSNYWGLLNIYRKK